MAASWTGCGERAQVNLNFYTADRALSLVGVRAEHPYSVDRKILDIFRRVHKIFIKRFTVRIQALAPLNKSAANICRIIYLSDPRLYRSLNLLVRNTRSAME